MVAAKLPYKTLGGIVPCPGGWLIVPARLAGVTVNAEEPEVVRTRPLRDAMPGYIPSSVLVDAVTWSGSAFGIGGAFPDVHWSGGQFQSGSGPRVLWQDDHFELEG